MPMQRECKRNLTIHSRRAALDHVARAVCCPSRDSAASRPEARILPTSRLPIFVVNLESNGGHAAPVSATGSPAGENYFVCSQRIWHPTASDDVERRRRSVAYISCYSGELPLLSKQELSFDHT